jgi:hypothetical protein
MIQHKKNATFDLERDRVFLGGGGGIVWEQDEDVGRETDGRDDSDVVHGGVAMQEARGWAAERKGVIGGGSGASDARVSKQYVATPERNVQDATNR